MADRLATAIRCKSGRLLDEDGKKRECFRHYLAPMLSFLLYRWSCLLLPLLARPSAAPPTVRVARIAPRVYVHTTYGEYQGTAVPANGLLVTTTAGTVLVDTGWNEAQTAQLVRYAADSLRQPVRLAIVTHAHTDRVAGTALLRARGIRVISTPLTARRAVALGYAAPEAAFRTDTTLRLGRTRLVLHYPGPGHAPDNIVVWLPQARVLFGGCLVKDAQATSLGNLDDADLAHWPVAVAEVARRYPNARVVVPGHYAWGGPEALTRTLGLLRQGKE